MLGEWFDGLFGLGLEFEFGFGRLGGALVRFGFDWRGRGGFRKGNVGIFLFMVMVIVVGWHVARGLVSCSFVEA